MMNLKDIVYKIIAGIVVLCAVILFLGEYADAKEDGFDLIVENNSDIKITFHLYWIDHPYYMNNPAPISSAAGEIEAGDKWTSTYRKKGEQYFIMITPHDFGESEVTYYRINNEETPNLNSLRVVWDGEVLLVYRYELGKLKGKLI